MTETPDEYLKRIREQSCYGTLRLVLRVSSLLLLVVALFLCLRGGIMLLSGTFGPVGPYEHIAIGLALVVLSIAGRQGSLLMVDAVDILIEQGRKKL